MLKKFDSERCRNEDNASEKPAVSSKESHNESQEKRLTQAGLRESTISDKELFYQLCNGGW